MSCELKRQRLVLLWVCHSFKSSQNRVIIDVNLYDEIDFICPHYPPPSSSSAAAAGSATDNRVDAYVVDDVSRSLEYYVVYQVSAFIRRRDDSRQALKSQDWTLTDWTTTDAFCLLSAEQRWHVATEAYSHPVTTIYQ